MQYMAKYISLPFFTILIINLQAKQPDMNAAINPTTSDVAGMLPIMLSPPIILTMSRRASPNMGGMTIKKEN